MFEIKEQELSLVKINNGKIGLLVRDNLESLKSLTKVIPYSNYDFDTNKDKLNFSILFSSINFCFWNDPEWYIEVGNKRLYRSKAVEILLFEEYKKNKRLLETNYLSELSFRSFAQMLNVKGEILLMYERWKSVTDTFAVLQEEFRGDPFEIIKYTDNDAYRLSKLIAEKFESFDDTATFNGRTIKFNKRAQLLVSTIADMEIVKLTNTDKLTAFADYRLPQLLRHLGVLEYADLLGEKINLRINIEAGSDDEIQIRIATVLAVERIKEELRQYGINIETRVVDSFLWNMAKTPQGNMKPHHQTLSIRY